MESNKPPRHGGGTMVATTKPSRFNRICVFCGSSSGKNPIYRHAAVQLGNQLGTFLLVTQGLRNQQRIVSFYYCFKQTNFVYKINGFDSTQLVCSSDHTHLVFHHLVERRIDLVYGGGSIGLMGLVSKAVFDGGCHVIGVIPKVLMPKEIIGETIGEVKPVLNMHQRKAEMARQADAFIALPGGYGTLEELLEVITWAQLGIHQKPVGLLNVDGYYNSLLSFIDKAVDEGFVTPAARGIIVSAQTAHELLSKLEEYDPEQNVTEVKLSWEMEQQLGNIAKSEIAR